MQRQRQRQQQRRQRDEQLAPAPHAVGGQIGVVDHHFGHRVAHDHVVAHHGWAFVRGGKKGNAKKRKEKGNFSSIVQGRAENLKKVHSNQLKFSQFIG